MSYSNRTSFMTAEQVSPRASFSSVVDQNIKFNTLNIHRNSNQTNNSQNRQDELPRSKSILKKKSVIQNLQENIPMGHEDHHQLGSRSSVSSEGVESGHTIINELPEGSYSSKEKSNVLNAEYHPSPDITSYDPAASELKTYPIAWLLLFFVVVLRAAVAIFGNTFSPIPSVIAEFMGVSLSSINWLYNAMSICYIIASFFTSWLYQAIGVKWSVSSYANYAN